MKNYGGYDIAHAGVISDVQNIGWVQDAYEKQEQEKAQQQQEIYVQNHIDLTVNIDGHQIASALAESGASNGEFVNMIQRVVAQ